VKIFPAIDLYEGQVVRLYKGDYNQMTVYGNHPLEVAKEFVEKGAEYIHVVDLEGAKSGETPNLEIIRQIAEETNLFIEVGGGIRTMEVIERYLSGGVDRVIIGTAAIEKEDMLKEALAKYREKIAVGVDIKDGFVAIKGWTEQSKYGVDEFCEKMQNLGVETIICTDISKDGAMKGTNRALYRDLSQKFKLKIIASGGVSTMEDVEELTKMNLEGAIIGKAYYVGSIDLTKAIEVAK